MEALQETHSRKTQSYGPLILALQPYIDSGWKVEILPWMVGARGIFRTELLTSELKFLEIPKQKWTVSKKLLTAHQYKIVMHFS